jgi:hypothetical protein
VRSSHNAAPLDPAGRMRGRAIVSGEAQVLGGRARTRRAHSAHGLERCGLAAHRDVSALAPISSTEAGAILFGASIREVGRGLVPRPGVRRTARPLRWRRIWRQRGLIACRERARRGTSPRPTSRTLRVPTGGSGWDPPCSLTRCMASSVAGLQHIATRARSIRQVRGERPCRVNRVVRAIDRADAVAVVACVSSRCERGASGRSEGRGLVA